MSIFRDPMLHPPGMATRARPNRARSGPSTMIEARIRLTSSYGASWESTGPVSIVTVCSSQATNAPRCSRTSAMVQQSTIRGTLSMTVRPGASSDAAMSLSAEFLAPPMGIAPNSGPPPVTISRSMRPPILGAGLPSFPDGSPPIHRPDTNGSRDRTGPGQVLPPSFALAGERRDGVAGALHLFAVLGDGLLVEVDAQAGSLGERDEPVGVDAEGLGQHGVAGLDGPSGRVDGVLAPHRAGDGPHDLEVDAQADPVGPGVRGAPHAGRLGHHRHLPGQQDPAGQHRVGLHDVHGPSLDEVAEPVEVREHLACRQ